MFSSILLLIFVGAVNYQNSLGMGLVFILVAMGLLSILQAFANLAGLKLTGLSPDPVFAGDMAEFPLRLESSRGCYSLALGVQGKIQLRVNVESKQDGVHLLRVLSGQRGWYHPGRFLLESSYPFGIIRCWSWVDLNQRVLVYPQPVAPPAHLQQTTGGDDLPRQPSARDGDDFEGTRRYRAGDSLRHVDWKAFARSDTLYSRQFSQPFGSEIWLRWDDFRGVAVELRLSYLCYLALALEHSNQAYGLQLPDSRLCPSSGETHLRQCLAALATFNRFETAGA